MRQAGRHVVNASIHESRPIGHAAPVWREEINVIRDLVFVVAVIVATILIVMAASTSFGARPLRIYDYGPPLAAGVVAVVALLRDASRK